MRIYKPHFAKEAVRAALDRREEAIPHLIRSIEWATEHLTDEKESGIRDYMLPLYALYLLAEMKDPSAYRPIVRLARHPQVDEMLGDAITEGLSGILAEFAVNDLEPLFELMRDENADEFARSAGITTLGCLALHGQLPLEKLGALIADLLETLPKEFGYHWDSLYGLIADFRLKESSEVFETHFDPNLCHGDWADLKYYQSELKKPLNLARLKDRSEYSAFSDTISELKDWNCFQEDCFPQSATEDYKPAKVVRDEAWVPPVISHERPKPVSVASKTGRNDPCPCGSGKKYKKCCGGAK